MAGEVDLCLAQVATEQAALDIARLEVAADVMVCDVRFRYDPARDDDGRAIRWARYRG